jgi:5-(hydroxymethyl)furfural/furfural oxidase
VRRRPNLNLITETGATAILFEEGKAVGAAIRRADGSGDALRANTVIVSAGAIHSPALLMRSGIGPADTLKTVGIAVLNEQNQLGRNLQTTSSCISAP